MRKFAIKNDYLDKNKTFAILNYDETKNEYTMDIVPDVPTCYMPSVAAHFAEKGEKQVDKKGYSQYLVENPV